MENAWTTIEVESRVRDPRVISHRRGGILVRARFVVPLALATVSRYKTEGSGGRERGEGVNVRPVGWFIQSGQRDRIAAKFFGRVYALPMPLDARSPTLASTDDSRRLTGWSASGDPGRKAVFNRVFYSRLSSSKLAASPFQRHNPLSVFVLHTRASLIELAPPKRISHNANNERSLNRSSLSIHGSRELCFLQFSHRMFARSFFLRSIHN